MHARKAVVSPDSLTAQAAAEWTLVAVFIICLLASSVARNSAIVLAFSAFQSLGQGPVPHSSLTLRQIPTMREYREKVTGTDVNRVRTSALAQSQT